MASVNIFFSVHSVDVVWSEKVYLSVTSLGRSVVTNISQYTAFSLMLYGGNNYRIHIILFLYSTNTVHIVETFLSCYYNCIDVNRSILYCPQFNLCVKFWFILLATCCVFKMYVLVHNSLSIHMHSYVYSGSRSYTDIFVKITSFCKIHIILMWFWYVRIFGESFRQ